jgi:hypothetical protein
MFLGKMRVLLRRREARVTEQLLNRAKIRTVLEQVRCESVSKAVGRKAGAEARLIEVLSGQAVDTPLRQTFSPGV